LVFPGTFTSLQQIELKPGDETGRKVLEAVKNVKLLYVGAICCGVGAGGMSWLVRLCIFQFYVVKMCCNRARLDRILSKIS